MPEDLFDAHFKSDLHDADDNGDGGEPKRFMNVGQTYMLTAFHSHLATAM
ncbi:hypothetical protein Syun_023372 [Stephania yunnanensis]|uniref:Uncharacterized protein n=1 Tax=Stephania yunnanensis TaxID=152371 RepID=A0AAP0F8W5_9MAGN